MNDSRPSQSLWQRAWHPFPTFRKLFDWIFSWRAVRACLFGLVCLATLIALFYAEENWRGQWAWNRYKRALERGGLDGSSEGA